MWRRLLFLCFIVSGLGLAGAARSQVNPDPDAPWYAMLRRLCKDPALVAQALERIERTQPKNQSDEFKWKLKVGCEQIFLPSEPRHDTADTSPGASHTGWINDARWSVDGRTIISAGGDGTVRTWDAETGKPIKTILAGQKKRLVGKPKPGIARYANFIGDGRLIAVGADEHPARLLDVASGQAIADLPFANSDPNHSFPPRMVATSNGILLLGGNSDEVMAIDTATMTVRYRLPGHRADVTALAVTEAAGLVATAMRDSGKGKVRLWSLDAGRLIAELDGLGNSDFDALAFSRDGRLLATVTDGSILVYSTGDKRVMQKIALHKYFGVFDLAFTADGKGLITCERHPILWSVDRGEIIRHFGPFTDLCHSVDVSPDGKLIVTGSAGSDVRIWEIATGVFHRRLGTNFRPPY